MAKPQLIPYIEMYLKPLKNLSLPNQFVSIPKSVMFPLEHLTAHVIHNLLGVRDVKHSLSLSYMPGISSMSDHPDLVIFFAFHSYYRVWNISLCRNIYDLFGLLCKCETVQCTYMLNYSSPECIYYAEKISGAQDLTEMHKIGGSYPPALSVVCGDREAPQKGNSDLT